MNNARFWTIATAEPRWQGKDIYVTINFPPEDFTYSPGKSNLAIFEGHGCPYPVLQWARGSVDEITFKSILWRHNMGVSSEVNIALYSGQVEGVTEDNYADRIRELSHTYMKELLDKLVGLTRQYEDLGRPPICIFTWSIWRVRCLVEQIGNIQIIASDENHVPLGYRFTVTLKRYMNYSTEDSYAISMYDKGRSGFTKHISFNDEDTYELIADREYGDPMLGIALRRLHSSSPFPTTGDVCKIPANAWTRTVRTAIRTPESPILKSSEDRINIFSDRLNNRSSGSRIILK